MAKQPVYSFVEKKHSRNGIIAASLGGGSLATLLALVLLAFLMKGGAPYWSGAVGFTGIAMAVCGLSYGFASFQDECKYGFFCRFGTLLSTAAITVWFFVVCLGLAS